MAGAGAWQCTAWQVTVAAQWPWLAGLQRVCRTPGSAADLLPGGAPQVAGGWRLNGRKRWIGNATFAEVVVIWARSSESRQVNAFIVRRGAPGFTTTKIENKIALRCAAAPHGSPPPRSCHSTQPRSSGAHCVVSTRAAAPAALRRPPT